MFTIQIDHSKKLSLTEKTENMVNNSCKSVIFIFLLFLVACAQTYYGPNCNLKCSTSCVNQTCDSRSGKCLTV